MRKLTFIMVLLSGAVFWGLLSADASKDRVQNLELGVYPWTFWTNDRYIVFLVDEGDQGFTDLNGDGDLDDVVWHYRDQVTNQVVNTNTAGLTGSAYLYENYFVFPVNEVRQGNTDLNGDGDVAEGDNVLHVLNLETQEIINLQTVIDTSGAFVGDGSLVAFLLNENNQGEDFNADGDEVDTVLAWLQLQTNDVHNSGYAVSDISLYSLAAGQLAFSVDELAQAEQDLNGDGDAHDDIVHYVRVGDEVVNLMIDSSGSTLTETGLSLTVSEGLNGGDLNGDGDDLDRVLHHYDGQDLLNLGYAAVGKAHEGDLVLFSVYEKDQGDQDLNNDGDSEDPVMFTFEPSTQQVTNLGLATTFGGSGDLKVNSGIAVFLVSESFQGFTDLNFDGDAADSVYYLYEADSQELKSTALARGGFADSQSTFLSDRYFAFRVSEQKQSFTDLNGDGDLSDHVMHVYNLHTDQIINTQIHGEDALTKIEGDMLSFITAEYAQGFQDFNSDGDFNDFFPLLFDLTSNQMISPFLAIDYDVAAGLNNIFLENGYLTYAVYEWDQGFADLNGDGDSVDRVIHVIRFPQQ